MDPTESTTTRRAALRASAGCAAALIAGSVYAASETKKPKSNGAEEKAVSRRKAKLAVVGAHPDDPESAAGGTMAAYKDAGHEVVSVYLTRGEAGIAGKSYDEAARIRTAEAGKACDILRSKPVFIGQIDGATEVNAKRYGEFAEILKVQNPDIVIVHWPIDSHRDHRVAALLTYDFWLAQDRRFVFYYFEVMSGAQSQLYFPTHYVDISATEPRKREACYAMKSQGPVNGFYVYHDAMNRFRGLEIGVDKAEAFVRHPKNRVFEEEVDLGPLGG